MLHLEMKLHRSDAASDSIAVAGAETAACECLNWKKTYADGLVKCGDGLEVPDVSKTSQYQGPFCQDFPGMNDTAFFPNADHKYCINAEKMTGPKVKGHPGPWCYVSSECPALRGGRSVNEKIKGDAQLMAVMAYEWEGPTASSGRSLLTQRSRLNATTPVIGASLKNDTFTILYGKEAWEVHDGPRGKCVQ